MKRKTGPKPKIAPPGYMRYGQAIEMFRPFDKNAFNYRVRVGDIQTQEDEQGKLYEVSSIERIKEYLSSQQKEEEYKGNFIIDWTKPEDFASGIKLDMQVYSPEIALADAETYLSWRKSNSERLSIAVFSEDRSERFASIKLMPLRDEQIALDILSGKRDESDIQPHEIRSYDEPGPYIILAIDVVALPGYPFLIGKILHKWMDFWVEQYPERWPAKIYAQAVSEPGLLMVQHFFMTPLWTLADNAFMLDVTRPSASKIVQKLQNRLKEKAPWPPVGTETAPLILPSPGAISKEAAPLYQFKVDREAAEAGTRESVKRTPVPGASYHSTIVHKAPESRPRERTEVSLLERPENTITLRELADELGINRTTLVGHVKNERNGLEHIAIPKPNRPGEYDRYFTAEQVAAVKAWHAAHSKK